MEHPAASSGPMLRRAATFSHRTERALKDVNGRLGLVHKSQEQALTSKIAADGHKVTRPTKQYSAVASRYAAPTISSKKAAEAHGGNVTKMPFTGRPAPLHQRRPSSDNVASFQSNVVFAASSRDAKSSLFAKKAEGNGTSFGSKRLRTTGVRASMIDQKSPAQTRAARFLSLDKSTSTGSKNGSVTSSVDFGSKSLLYSAAHWLKLIKLAEGEKKHEVVVDLFRLAITLKAEPSETVVAQLKQYQHSCPSDKLVGELIQQCEGTRQVVCSSSTDVVDKAVCEPEDSRNTASSTVADVPPVGKITIVPPVVSENEPVVKMDEVPAKKAPPSKGRMLSRSATFSVVDEESQSQHAKADYGKKLAKTLEFLSTTNLVKTPGANGEVADSSPSSSHSPVLACVPEAEIADNQATPGFSVGFKILDLAAKIGRKVVAAPTSENFSSPVREPGLTGSTLANGSAEKPVDSLSEWLDGDKSETGTPDVQSAPREDTVDLSPNTRGAVKNMDVDSLMSQVVAHILPEGIAKSPVDVIAITPVEGISTTPVEAVATSPGEAVDTSPVEAVDTSPVEVIATTPVEAIATIPVEAVATTLDACAITPVGANAVPQNGRSSTRDYHVRRKSWQDAGDHSVTEIIESISRSHRHSFSAEAIFLSAPGSVEQKVKLFAPGSVEQKVKMFAGLVEQKVKVSSPGASEHPAPGSASKEFQEVVGESVEDIESLERDICADASTESLSAVDTEALVATGESATETTVVMESVVVPSEASKVTLATPRRASPKGTIKRSDGVLPPIPATPGCATPCEPASVAILKARHRRSSSAGNVTPRAPFDLAGERPAFGESPGSPSGQSSSSKSKRVSRGFKEVTPRMDLPKPSWKSVIEREMKGSKLKDLLASELPLESSPLAEYVQVHMGNQNRDPEKGSKDANSASSPARPVRKMTRSSSMKKPGAKEENGGVEPRSALKKQNEGEHELEASMNGSSTTPGSAIRRSARLQSKVHSRKDVVPSSKLFV